MRTPIQLALSYPDRLPATAKRLGLSDMARLEFLDPDPDRFPCLRLAREAAATGGTMPAFLSVANEELVRAFLSRRIKFGAVPDLMERAMRKHEAIKSYTLEILQEVEREARTAVKRLIVQNTP